MSVVLDMVAGLLSALLPSFVPKGRGADRRLLAEDRVRCAIRAVEGRVLNIGTEWSTGTCEINRGSLRFVPSMGIVGDREIEVQGLHQIEAGTFEQLVTAWGDSANLIISTGSGDLHWVIPHHVLDKVIDRLRPPEA